MFRCERCGSRYNAMHAVAIENCPRCQIRDRITAPLSFKPFQTTDSVTSASAQAGTDRPGPARRPRPESLSQPRL